MAAPGACLASRSPPAFLAGGFLAARPAAVSPIPSRSGIAGMRAACKLAARALDFAGTLIKTGDIMNVDVNVFLNGYHGGASRTFVCGEVDDSIRHFLKAAEECLEKGITVCRDGVNYKKIGKKIRTYSYNGKG
uniref:Peptidase M24 domain-containing protein n=1 Tax=Oryza rufipogon TaxID=4529 RepID=A0A0E0Q8U1_ORYRU